MTTAASTPHVSREQWLVLGGAWLGWVFDSMDATIYVLVLHPALSDLLRDAAGSPPSQESIGWYGGLIFSIFLIGWTIGGILFGIVADRIGRTRTLVITILIYSLFTGLAALSVTWWHLAAARFLTALGIGGEWAAGAALVAETWPEEKRTQAAGILQSAWGVGFFLAAGFNVLLSGQGWRVLFVVGVLPAMVAVVIRVWVKESDRWLQARSRSAVGRTSWHEGLTQILRPPLVRRTCIGAGLAFVAVCGLWGATNWAPTLIRSLPEFTGVSAREVAAPVGYAVMALNAGAIVGYLSFGPLAERFGRRPIFAMMCLGSLVMVPLTFLTELPYRHMLLILPMLGFFSNGIFSGFPIYLPELFPTVVRATGAGFCFNAGRIFAAAGPFVTGSLVTMLGNFGRAASAVAVVYALGLVILTFAPETRGRPLPP